MLQRSSMPAYTHWDNPGTFLLRCTHVHSHTHTGWPSDEISFCHLACCVTRCISTAKASAANPALSLSGVSLKATHTAEEPHTLGDGKSIAATLQMTPKTSLFFSSFLPRLLSYLYTWFVSLEPYPLTHTTVAGSDLYPNFLCGFHMDRNDDLALSSTGYNQWNTKLSFSFASCYKKNPHTAVWLLHPGLVILSLWSLLSALAK